MGLHLSSAQRSSSAQRGSYAQRGSSAQRGSRAAGRRRALAGLLGLAGVVAPLLAAPASAGTPIQDHWSRLGAERSVVGRPVSGELVTADRVGRWTRYERGSIHWAPATGAHEVHGDIQRRWAGLGSERSPLAYPVTDESGTPDGVGRFNHFQRGSIYWTPATGAHEVYGAIRDRWTALRWETGPLGYPTTGEHGTPDGRGRFTHFQRGSIYWTPATGAQEVYGAIRDAWARGGWETGPLGYPVSGEYGVPGGRASDFTGGRITWGAATGRVTVTAPGSATATGTATPTTPTTPTTTGGHVLLSETADGPDLRPYASTSLNSTNPLWHVEGGSSQLDRVGGVLTKTGTSQFHRAFSKQRFGGAGKKIKITYRGRATAIRNRSGSSIIEGAKLGMKFPVSSSITGYSKDDPRSVYGTSSQSDPKSPGSFIFLTGLTEGGYMELSRNGYGNTGYQFFANKRVGYTPGTWKDISVTVEWLGSDIRVRYFHNSTATGAPVYEAVDRNSPFAGESGFLWLRTDDADWEYDYVKIEEF